MSPLSKDETSCDGFEFFLSLIYSPTKSKIFDEKSRQKLKKSKKSYAHALTFRCTTPFSRFPRHPQVMRCRCAISFAVQRLFHAFRGTRRSCDAAVPSLSMQRLFHAFRGTRRSCDAAVPSLSMQRLFHAFRGTRRSCDAAVPSLSMQRLFHAFR